MDRQIPPSRELNDKSKICLERFFPKREKPFFGFAKTCDFPTISLFIAFVL